MEEDGGNTQVGLVSCERRRERDIRDEFNECSHGLLFADDDDARTPPPTSFQPRYPAGWYPDDRRKLVCTHHAIHVAHASDVPLDHRLTN